jgi:hypothetical protein
MTVVAIHAQDMQHSTIQYWCFREYATSARSSSSVTTGLWLMIIGMITRSRVYKRIIDHYLSRRVATTWRQKKSGGYIFRSGDFDSEQKKKRQQREGCMLKAERVTVCYSNNTTGCIVQVIIWSDIQ